MDTWAPVSSETRAGRVARRFVELIKEGTLRPGDRVPSEAELAKLLGVGRSTVREAKGLLLAKQLISGIPGRGTFINDLHGFPIDQDMLHLFLRKETWRELLEVRLLLEGEITYLACLNATEDDINILANSLNLIASAPNTSEMYDRTIDFHQLVANTSKNMVLAKLYQVVTTLLHSYQKPRMKSTKQIEFDSHNVLLDAIRGDDPIVARDEAKRHVLLAVERTDLPLDSKIQHTPVIALEISAFDKQDVLGR